MVGFGSIGVGNSNGGSSSSFSNLSPLAPPFTLDRSFTKPISTSLVDINESSFGIPLNSSLHNWFSPSSQSSGLDYFSNPTSEFDWIPFSTASPSIEPSDNHVPLLGGTWLSSEGDSSESLTTSIGKAKPYYPSYASTFSNKGCPLVIADQTGYDWLSNPHITTFDVPSCKNYSRGSSGSERSVEEASHCVDMLGLNKCSESVRELPNEDLFLEGCRNTTVPGENLRIGIVDAYSAFPGCHPKTKTSPLNSATSSQNCQVLKNAPYREILRERDSRLSETTTSVFNSPATFSIRPPVANTDSYVWNIGPCKNSDYGYNLAEGKQGGNSISNTRDFLPFNLENEAYYDTENHVTCIDKNDPVITESLSAKTQDLPNSIYASKDSSDHMLKAEVGHHSPNLSPHLSLDLKTVETVKAFWSSSDESFDQYNLAVDSPCWKGAPVSRFSTLEASEIVTPHNVMEVETCDDVNFSLPQIPHCTAVDTVKVFVHEPSESTIERSLENSTASSPKRPSVASAVPAEQKTRDSVKTRDFYSKRSHFHPVFNNSNEPVGDDGDSVSSYSLPHDNYKHDLMSEKRISSLSFMEKRADARSNNGDGSSHDLLCSAGEHVQHLLSCTEDTPSKLTNAYHGKPNSKKDIQILVDTVHNLSELLLAYCSNGMGALQQKDVKSLQNVMGNLDMCITNSVGPRDSLFPEQRTSQNLGKIHQFHRDLGVPKYDENGVEKKNQHIFSVKKDKRAANSLYMMNDRDSTKEDNMTQALKKVLSENFHDEEGEHPQTLLYKNLWLEAEAALCTYNFKSRFNRAKLEIEKHVSSKVRENAKNQDGQSVSDINPGPSTIGKLASETKVGAAPFISVQTSPAISASSHADDVITRFHILKCRDDEAKCWDGENSGKPPGFKTSVEPDAVEKLALDNNRTAVPDIKDMNSPCPTSKVTENDFGEALAATSPILTRSSHTDDVMSRFLILKSRDEPMNSVNDAKVHKISSSNCSKIVTLAPKRDSILGSGISMKYPPDAESKNEVDCLGDSVYVVRSLGSITSSIPAGGQLHEEVVYQHSAGKRDYWPIVDNKVKGGFVEMEPFLQLEPGVSEKHGLIGNESTTYVEDKLPAGFDGSSSDWEHVLWGE